MHTALQLRVDMFQAERNGAPVARHQVLPGWTASSRLGVVVDAPLGALGASLMIQLAITAYYDVEPARRTGPATYAEVFLFHVRGRHGSHAGMDIWPGRKEIFVQEGPDELLAQINNCAISHLLVPAAEGGEHLFPYKEPAASADRIRACFAYSADGAVPAGDLRVSSVDDAPLANVRAVIEPEILIGGAGDWRHDPDPARLLDKDRFFATLERRRLEVSPSVRRKRLASFAQRSRGGRLTETYRTISFEAALRTIATAA